MSLSLQSQRFGDLQRSDGTGDVVRLTESPNPQYRAEGDSFQADKPQVWLDARLGGRPRAPSRDLDLHPDGKRFVIGSSDEQSPEFRNHVVLVFNFFDELRRIAPSRNRD